MADYVAYARSNYFRVLNDEAFLDWCEEVDLVAESRDKGDRLEYVIFPNTGDGAWPSLEQDADGDDVDREFTEELIKHLDPDDIIVLNQIGHEKRRYVDGVALALAADGTQWRVCLEDVYQLVAADTPTKRTTSVYM